MSETVTLHSRILGENNPPLLILHGLYGSSDNWLSIGTKLSKYFTVHLIDLRNHGNSPHHPTHNYQVMCEDLRLYLDTKKISKCILAGHSMGGKTAMLFSLIHPTFIEKLIILDIAPKDYPENMEGHLHLLKVMQELPIENLYTRSKIIEIVRPLLKKENLVQLLLKNIRRNKQHTFSWKINIEALKHNILEITGGTSSWKKEATNIPTLFLKGEKSLYLTKDDYFFIQLFFSRFEVMTVPNAGHWLHAEQPKTVINKILDFSLS